MPGLSRWARGRLPRWARARMDTEDLVQEAFFGLFRRLPYVEPKRRGALRAYLKQAIRNRIRDEVRRAGQVEVSGVTTDPRVDPDTSPLAALIAAENKKLYRQALAQLAEGDRELIVGRMDLGFSYEQLALATGRPSADAARVAVRRALVRLSEGIQLE